MSDEERLEDELFSNFFKLNNVKYTLFLILFSYWTTTAQTIGAYTLFQKRKKKKREYMT